MLKMAQRGETYYYHHQMMGVVNVAFAILASLVILSWLCDRIRLAL